MIAQCSLTLSLYRVQWINESGWHESLALVVSGHPVPVRILRVEHRDALSALHAQVVLVLRSVRVEHDVAAGGLLVERVHVALLAGGRGRVAHQRVGAGLVGGAAAAAASDEASLRGSAAASGRRDHGSEAALRVGLVDAGYWKRVACIYAGILECAYTELR